ncbi:DUF6461 domain-containing protein [Streptomyces sp. NPDC004783]|uniref:DUF6461 domain-containing protein n=1 Tax=Streptomyces sp. NPDC004783 TaxID=3154459 RepID=UPI0033A1F445
MQPWSRAADTSRKCLSIAASFTLLDAGSGGWGAGWSSSGRGEVAARPRPDAVVCPGPEVRACVRLTPRAATPCREPAISSWGSYFQSAAAHGRREEVRQLGPFGNVTRYGRPVNRSPCCEKSASLPPSRESTTSAPPDVDRKAAVLAQAKTLTGIRVTESLLQDGTYEPGLVPDQPAEG